MLLKTLDERKEAEQREQLVVDIRKRLSELGPYCYTVCNYTSQMNINWLVVWCTKMIGTCTFVYENGELIYEEEQ